MIKRLALLYELLRSPHLFYKQLRVLKEIDRCMRLIAVEALSPTLRSLVGRSVDIDELMVKGGYSDRGLLVELLSLVEKEGVVRLSEGKVVVLRNPPEGALQEASEEMGDVLREAFGTFIDPTVKAIRERLSGKATREFDADELRVHWSIALEGEFYRIQREKAIEFSKLVEEARRRRGTFRILDYGCGSGAGTLQLFNSLSGKVDDFEVDGCDVSEGLLEIAREDVAVGLPIHFFSLKKNRPAKGIYDAVFVSHVLHWTDDPVKTVGELKSYLKNDGFIFGVESTISKRLYPVDLFIRIYGANGFPSLNELQRWFNENNMKLEHDPVWFSFKAISISPNNF